MTIITTISDLKNIIDGWDANGDLTHTQLDYVTDEIRNRAHAAGLAYGADWEAFLNSISIDDVYAIAAFAA